MSYKHQFIRKTIRKSTLDALISHYGLKKNSPEWRFLYYALFGYYYDYREINLSNKRILPFSQYTVTELEGRRISVTDFLNKMARRFPKYKLKEENYGPKQKCKTASFEIPESVFNIVIDELHTVCKLEERVFGLTGRKVTREVRKNLQRERIERVRNSQEPNGSYKNKSQRIIASYLNELPNQLFERQVNSTYMLASEALENVQDILVRENQKNLYEDIQSIPKPIYKPANTSTRLYGSGICQLKREVRKAITNGWYEADLKSIQLAVNAKVWGFEELECFLAEGGDWWQELFDYLDKPFNDELKANLKIATYAIFYGASEESIRTGYFAGEEFWDNRVEKITYEGWPEIGEKLLKHPLVQAILGRRIEMKKLLKERGGYEDAYGRYIELTSKRRYGSVLSYVAQSYEQLLLYPIFKLAGEGDNSKEFRVVLYLHDGVYLWFREAKYCRKWKDVLTGSVEKVARRNGIITTLEWS